MGKHKKNKNKNLKTNSSPNNVFLNPPIGIKETSFSKPMISSSEALINSLSSDFVSNDENLLASLFLKSPLVQRMIRQPVEDALRGGVEIVSESLKDKVKEITSYLEEHGVLDTVKHAFNTSRLYGGACILLNSSDIEINDELNIEHITKDIDISLHVLSKFELKEDKDNEDFYIVRSDFSVHRSRLIFLKNKEVPYCLKDTFGDWGYSEVERLKTALNCYNKSLSVMFELIDEAKLDIFKIFELNEDIERSSSDTRNETMDMIHRVNYTKNYKNAIVLDKNDEFTQKSINFSGLEIISNTVSSAIVTASEMNRTKILGEQPSGFSSDNSSTEDYNALVESSVRSPMKKVLRQIITLIMKKLFNNVFEFELNFKSLRILSDLETEEIKTKKTSRLISLLNAGIIDQKEAKVIAIRENLI